MREFDLGDFRIRLGLEGARRYQKVSFPLTYGWRHEVQTPEYVFQYNLNGEIRYIRGRGQGWPHPSEWLKRTDGFDWIYYGSGGYTDVYDVFGEYYIPYPSYPTNILGTWNPFGEPAVRRALQAWAEVPERLAEHKAPDDLAPEELGALHGIIRCTPGRLREKVRKLSRLLRGRVSVLPPDVRHVDYDCIPLAVAEGCLYNCLFCRVKSGRSFRQRSSADVQRQVRGLRTLYGPDAANYNSLFLAHHDALNCDSGHLESAADQGFEALGLRDSRMEGSNIFLFGSTASLLQAGDRLFERLQALAAQVYVNVGFESADRETLRALGKPVKAGDVRAAFQRMLDVNRRFRSVEVTGNFVLAPDLSSGHFKGLHRLTAEMPEHRSDKGAVYLSPLHSGNRREQFRLFREIKRRSRLPVYVYLILRL